MPVTKFISRWTLADSRIDRANNVIKGVSLVSLGEARGHNKRADETTLQQVRDCARQYKGGLRVRFNPSTFNHGDAGLAGFIAPDSIEVRDGKVVGDMHVYAAFPHKDYLYEIAERAPDNFGLSIEFNGDTEQKDGEFYARCDEIFAATVVDLPAANPTGLFSVTDVTGTKYAPAEPDDPEKWSGDDPEKMAAITPHKEAIATHRDAINGHLNAMRQIIGLPAVEYKSLTNADTRLKTINQTQENMTDEEIAKLTTGITAGITEGLKPMFQKFRQQQGTESDDPPTQDEMDAAGCTDDMSDDEKQDAVTQWRKKSDKPLTKKDLMQFFRLTGGKPVKVSADGGAKKNGDGFESTVKKYREAGMSESKAVNRAARDDKKGYNEWCAKGRPTIVL